MKNAQHYMHLNIEYDKVSAIAHLIASDYVRVKFSLEKLWYLTWKHGALNLSPSSACNYIPLKYMLITHALSFYPVNHHLNGENFRTNSFKSNFMIYMSWHKMKLHDISSPPPPPPFKEVKSGLSLLLIEITRHALAEIYSK